MYMANTKPNEEKNAGILSMANTKKPKLYKKNVGGIWLPVVNTRPMNPFFSCCLGFAEVDFK